MLKLWILVSGDLLCGVSLIGLGIALSAYGPELFQTIPPRIVAGYCGIWLLYLSVGNILQAFRK